MELLHYVSKKHARRRAKRVGANKAGIAEISEEAYEYFAESEGLMAEADSAENNCTTVVKTMVADRKKIKIFTMDTSIDANRLAARMRYARAQEAARYAAYRLPIFGGRLALAAVLAFGAGTKASEAYDEMVDGSICRDGNGRVAMVKSDFEQLRADEDLVMRQTALQIGVRFNMSHPVAGSANVFDSTEKTEIIATGNALYDHWYDSSDRCEYSPDGSPSDVNGRSVQLSEIEHFERLQDFVEEGDARIRHSNTFGISSTIRD